jgi:hypothetical protein
MCMKRRHGNGWLSHEGYSPAIVVVATELYTRWVTRIFISLFSTHFPNPPDCSFIWKLIHLCVCVCVFLTNTSRHHITGSSRPDFRSWTGVQSWILQQHRWTRPLFRSRVAISWGNSLSFYFYDLTLLWLLMMQLERLHNATRTIAFFPRGSSSAPARIIKLRERKSLIKLICWTREGYKFIPIWEASSFILLFCILGSICWKYIELQLSTLFPSTFLFTSLWNAFRV